MSADNGYVVRKNAQQKIVVQHYFASSDEYPDINDVKHGGVFDTLDEAIATYNDRANETEYGFAFYL